MESLGFQLPKAMFQVAGRPFLTYLLDYLINIGFKKAVLLCGYRFISIQRYFGLSYRSLEISYSIENYPQGTGGAIKYFLTTNPDLPKRLFIMNGDTLLSGRIEIPSELSRDKFHAFVTTNQTNDCRFDVFNVDSNDYLLNVDKNCSSRNSLIGLGIYMVDTESARRLVAEMDVPSNFEEEFFKRSKSFGGVKCVAFSGDFIDIGTPIDYHQSEDFINKYVGGA